MKRIMTIGQAGSGKSTLAIKLGRKTGLPVYHMDHIHWMRGWVERPRDEKVKLTRDVHTKDRWIFEGGFSSTWDERFDRADILIWLDFSLQVRLWRILKRRFIYYGQTRPDMAEGCHERISWSFLKWIFQTRISQRNRCKSYFELAGENGVWLRSVTEVDRFVENFPF